ncbi:ArsR family transcriptional regulator [Methanosalsum natronophilum]|uniref:ArsR family transcriptional regulator n=1 Tax=Methanosalsum natronophilum TaxID=768733 RepID=A0A424YNW1_9EURY|nr:MAG: ArsR family transcriptional regulator [Methanosalsum natronophilum]
MNDEENKSLKHEWIQKMKSEGKIDKNPTKDHESGLKTLQNPTRRKILQVLTKTPRTLDEIKKELVIDKMQAKFHLEMLEASLFIEQTTKDNNHYYILSPRGKGYIDNAKMGK